MWKRGTLLRTLFGVALLGIVAWRVDWPTFLQFFTSVRPWWLAALFGLHLFDRIFMAAKWRYLLAALKVDISLKMAVVHYFVGGLVGEGLQWHLGGDVSRALEVGRRTGARAAVASSVAIEKLAGFSALGLVATVSGTVLNVRLDLVPRSVAVSLAGMSAIVFVATAMAVVSQRAREGLRRVLEKVPFAGVRERIENLVTGIGLSSPVFRARYGRFFGLTLLEQFVGVAGFFLLTRSFSVDMSLVEVVAFFPILEFFSRLPISPQALGVREGLAVLLLGLFGIGSGTAFGLAVGGRAVGIIVMIAGAAFAVSSRAWRGDGRSSTS